MGKNDFRSQPIAPIKPFPVTISITVMENGKSMLKVSRPMNSMELLDILLTCCKANMDAMKSQNRLLITTDKDSDSDSDPAPKLPDGGGTIAS